MSDVDAWMDAYDGALKPVMQRVREIILTADGRIGECIKWNTPTFDFRGPMASFNPRSKAHVSLLFHRGAEIPGNHSALEGDSAQARTMRLADVAEVDRKAVDIAAVTRAWCDWKEIQPKGKAAGS